MGRWVGVIYSKNTELLSDYIQPYNANKVLSLQS